MSFNDGYDTVGSRHLDIKRRTWELAAPFEGPANERRTLAVRGSSFDASGKKFECPLLGESGRSGAVFFDTVCTVRSGLLQ